MKFKDTMTTKTIANRTLALLLSACMIGTSFGSVPLAAYASQGTDGLCEHHTAHDSNCGYSEEIQGHECTHAHNDSCGYQAASSCSHTHNGDCGYSESSAGSPCTYTCDVCNGSAEGNNTNEGNNGEGQNNDDPADESDDPEEDPVAEPEADGDEECICTKACTEESVNAECPVCKDGGADMSLCKGAKQEPDENEQDDPIEDEDTAVRYIVTAWEWIDEEENLDPESGALVLSATEEAPCMFEDVAELLPMQIRAELSVYRAEDEEDTDTDAEDTDTESKTDIETNPLTLENTTSMDLDAADWVCEEYPEEGAYKGSYTFITSLPEGYGLSEDAKALEVEVLFDAPQVLDEAKGYTTEGFCTAYKWESGSLVKDSTKICSHSEGNDCSDGYQPAVQITNENKNNYTFTGTTKDYAGYYAITNAGQLYWFAAHVNGWNKDNDTRASNAVLINNITVNSGLLNDNGELNTNAAVRSWIPIGCNDKNINPKQKPSYFQGTFDGQNHTIFGIYCRMPESEVGAGLFGYLFQGTISNVTLTDSYITGKACVGGICGQADKKNSGTITYCTNHATVVATDSTSFAGGISGIGGGSISDCTNNGKISGIQCVGGICGSTRSGIVMPNCTNTGSVIGTGSNVGGICGQNAGNIKTSTNSGSISGKEQVGGICGSNGDPTATVEECKNSGSVTGTKTDARTSVNIGGICGVNSGTIKKCDNQAGGTVSVSTKLSGVGGVCGKNMGRLEECTNAATVTGFYSIGGICGYTYGTTGSTPVILSCTNNGTVNYCESAGAGADPNAIGGICGKNDTKGSIQNSSNNSKINVPSADNVGGICGENEGSISNVTGGSTKNIGNITGGANTGGICGYSTGSVVGENTGGVTGTTHVGGICGNYAYSTAMSGSTNSGSITGTGERVGGICGVADGELKDCKNTGSTVTGSGNFVGGICGSGNAITDCTNQASVTGSGEQTGGICGRNKGKITNCTNQGAVTGNGEYVGGISGYSESSVEGSENTASVEGKNKYVGGICGYNQGESVKGCTNSGTVTGAGSGVGGICGSNGGTTTTTATVDGCKNMGAVTGKKLQTGGIVGESSASIVNCKNSGKVSGEDSYTGGIFGYMSSKPVVKNVEKNENIGDVNGTSYVGGIGGYSQRNIAKCSNTGIITANGNCVGGISGFASSSTTISQSYNTGSVSGQKEVGGIGGSASVVSHVYNTGKVTGTEWKSVGVICGGASTSKEFCYYLDSIKKNGIHAVEEEDLPMTASDFSSGKVAWLLNDSKSDNPTWYQWIDADGKTKEASPVLAINRSSDSTGSGEGSGGTESTTVNYGTVYQCKQCTGAYSNTGNKQAEHILIPSEKDSNKHICKNCGSAEEEHSVSVYTGNNTNHTISGKCVCSKDLGSFTLSAPAANTLTYDNTKKEASVSGTITGVTETPTISYAKVADNEADLLLTGDDKPTDAGTYKASITCGSGDDAVTVSVTYIIAQATPTVGTAPTVNGITYNPSTKLSGINLNTAGTTVTTGTVNGINGSALQGIWSWKTPDQVPGVNNSGYKAIFAPDDPNYEPVTCTITVTVAKVTPHITTAPTAAAITYGEPLRSSALTGGSVQYSDSDATSVAGSFVWKDGSSEPTAANDSNNTPYTVIFKPTDSDNYNEVETQITITVNKASYPSNKPSDTMSVANSCTMVGSATLPSGWAWKNDDRSKELEVGVPVTATAVYEGEDKDNYEAEGLETSVAITRKAVESSGSSGGIGSGNGSSGSSESSTAPTPQPTPVTLLPTPVATQNPLLPDGNSKPTAGTPLIGNAPEDDADDPNKAPFIKGENGKEGWEIIRTETEGTPEGSTVTVDMNGAVVVPSEVLSDIQGRDVTLVFDMGNGITWSVNGLSITGEVGDIDFGVTMGAQAGRSIPVEVINNVTGERTSLNLTLTYEGEFGFTAVLTVNMQAENAGLYANLFYYNPSTGELEFICCDLIREDGTTDLTFTHASDYTIVIDSVPMDGSVKAAEDAPEADAGNTDGSTDEADGAGNTDSAVTTDSEAAWNPLWIILIGTVVIVVGLGVFVIAKKKRETSEQ